MGNAKWLFALLVLDLIALLCALSFSAITAQGPAERALGRSVAILTQVDAYLDEHFQSIRQEAAQTREQRLTLPDFPVAVSFTAGEVQHADRNQFRALLLKRAAAVLHRDGMSAFRQGRPSRGSTISPEGAIRTGMELLRPGPHWVFVGLTVTLGLGAALLALKLTTATPGYARMQTLGLITAFASALFLVLAIATWIAFRLATAAVDDYLTREFLTLGQQLTRAPIRNGLVIMVGGAALASASVAIKTRGRQRV